MLRKAAQQCVARWQRSLEKHCFGLKAKHPPHMVGFITAGHVLTVRSFKEAHITHSHTNMFALSFLSNLMATERVAEYLLIRHGFFSSGLLRAERLDLNLNTSTSEYILFLSSVTNTNHVAVLKHSAGPQCTSLVCKPHFEPAQKSFFLTNCLDFKIKDILYSFCIWNLSQP